MNPNPDMFQPAQIVRPSKGHEANCYGTNRSQASGKVEDRRKVGIEITLAGAWTADSRRGFRRRGWTSGAAGQADKFKQAFLARAPDHQAGSPGILREHREGPHTASGGARGCHEALSERCCRRLLFSKAHPDAASFLDSDLHHLTSIGE